MERIDQLEGVVGLGVCEQEKLKAMAQVDEADSDSLGGVNPFDPLSVGSVAGWDTCQTGVHGWVSSSGSCV